MRRRLISVLLCLSAAPALQACQSSPGDDLVSAAQQGDLVRVKEDLAHKAMPDARNSAGVTALMLAATEGQGPIVAALLAAGAKVNATDRDGGTALIWAARGTGPSASAIISDLLAAGADVHARDATGRTPLSEAAMFGKPVVVPLLVKAGENVNQVVINGNTPLLWAVAGDNPAMVSSLLDAGADINAAGAIGATPLHLARIEGKQDVIDLLKMRGARE